MASNKVYASYQEIIDLHTEPNHVSVVGIHTPTGDTPYKMFRGLFEQFKKYKYRGCSVSLVPAARLPVDIEAVGNMAGDPNVDARDLLNPIMVHGCHGEDLGNILNRLYAIGGAGIGGGGLLDFDRETFGGAFEFSEQSSSLTQNSLENLYYKALVDNTWKKAHPQRGFKKSGLRPLVYSMATTHQLGNAVLGNWSPEDSSVMGSNDNGNLLIGGEDYPFLQINANETATMKKYKTFDGAQFLTPHLTGLGYLDTRTVLDAKPTTKNVTSDLNNVEGAFFTSWENWTQLPLIFMLAILLPPAYKAVQHYRLIVNHRFTFKDFRGISMSNSQFESPSYFNVDHEINPSKRDPVQPDLKQSIQLYGTSYPVSTYGDSFRNFSINNPADDKFNSYSLSYVIQNPDTYGNEYLMGTVMEYYSNATGDHYFRPVIVGLSAVDTLNEVYWFNPTEAYPTRFSTPNQAHSLLNLDQVDLEAIFGEDWDLVLSLYHETKENNSADYEYVLGDPDD